MNTHQLASHLRRNRRPAQPHLGFSFRGALVDAGTAALDSAQSSGGDLLQEKVTEATGSEAIGQATRAGFDAGVDSAQGQNQQPASQQPFTFIPVLPSNAFEGVFRAIEINKKAKEAAANLTPEQIELLKRSANFVGPRFTPTGVSQEQFILDTEEPAPEAEAASSKKGWIIGGSILAVALIGGGVFLATRKK